MMELVGRCRPWHQPSLRRLSLRPSRDGTLSWFTVSSGRLSRRSLSLFLTLFLALFMVVSVTAPAARAASGAVWAWGYNSYGPLGDGSSNSRYSPILSLMADAVDLAAGADFSLFVKPDGTVWACGSNYYGQLGIEDTLYDVYTPVLVNGVTGATAVAAGYGHSLALKSGGTVWAWGDNSYGQLGDGTSNARYSPAQVSGLTDVTAIASGAGHNLALKSDGTVWAWGYNGEGQLGVDTGPDGYGGYISALTPVTVPGLTNVIAIAAGEGHSLALKSDGTVWAWGRNHEGQLGVDTGPNVYDGYLASLTPVQVSSLSNVTAIAAGGSHSLAILSGGTVRAWGYNFYGELGDGTTTNSVTPVQVNGLSNVTAIGSGSYHSLAILSGGTVWAWGHNADGQLGDGTSGEGVHSNVPVQASNLTGAIKVAGGSSHSLALVVKHLRFTTQPGGAAPGIAFTRQPVVSAFNGNGTPDTSFTGDVTLAIAPGSGTAGASLSGTTTRAAIAGVSTFSGLSVSMAGTGYRLAATSAAHPNALSDTFNAASVAGHQPAVTAPSGQTAVVGYQNTFRLGSFTDAGDPATDGPWNVSIDWGDGSMASAFQAPNTGALPMRAHAYASANSYTVTVMVTDRAGDYGSATFQIIAALLPPAGTLLAWGYNAHGQLGDGTQMDKTSPTVSRMAAAATVDGGAEHNVALKSDDTAWIWGRNNNGQLGDGTTADSAIPFQMTGLGSVRSVVAGGYHSLALDSNGALWSWGKNDKGQLGVGTTTDSSSPNRVITDASDPTSYLADVVALSASHQHSLALKADGTVWAWGANWAGQMGDKTKINRLTPVQITGLSDIIAISAGFGHSLALKSDRTVWAWGDNYNGQLGGGTSEYEETHILVQVIANNTDPVNPVYLSNVTAIAAGHTHSLALKADGTVWAWGTNYSGELGSGTTDYQASIPVQVMDPLDGTGFLTGVTALDAFGSTSMALKSDGTIRVWGDNYYGQLGNGTYNSSNVAIPVPGIAGAVQVIAGEIHSLALLGKSLRFSMQPTDTTAGAAVTPTVAVKAYNTDGTPDLSFSGSVTLSIRPYTGAAGATLSNATATASGGVATFTGLSVSAAGTGYMLVATAAGYAEAGSLPFDMAAALAHAPVVTAPADQAASVSLAKSFDIGAFTDAGADGPWSVSVSWGDGTADTTLTASTAAALPQASHTYTAAGSYTVAVTVIDQATSSGSTSFPVTVSLPTPTGAIWSWGDNTYGPLGDGTTITSVTPVLSLLSEAIEIAGGLEYTLAVTPDGTVRAWGRNNFGQLGNGTTVSSQTPVTVSGLTNVTVVAAGSYHGLARDKDGAVWAWGKNDTGQLGNGTLDSSTTPVQVSGLTGVVAVAAGIYHSLALKSDHTVWAWGGNTSGELGNGTTSDSSTPVQVTGLTDIIAIASGTSHGLALKSDGTVWAWGHNTNGQLGNGATVNSATPIQVSGLTGVTAIGGGNFHSLAILTDGTVWTWGANTDGQLGDGTRTSSATPVQASGLTGAVAVVGGNFHSLALKSDGTVWAWGNNWKGQLGIGSSPLMQNTPVPVPAIAGAIRVSAGYAHSLAICGKSLRFTTQPGLAQPGVAFGIQPAVTAYNGNGTADTAFAGPVSLAIAPGTGSPGAALSGTTTVTASAGVATFSGLSINLGGTGYRLQATSTGYSIAVSAPLAVGHPPAVTAAAGQTAYQGIDQSLLLGSFTDEGGDGPWSVTISWGDSSSNTTFTAAAVGALPPKPHIYSLVGSYTVTVTVTDQALASDSATFTATVSTAPPAGTLLAWGDNTYGEIGDGSTTNRYSPFLTLMPDATSIAAGGFHVLALKADGTVWACGRGTYGELGNGNAANSNTPVQVITNSSTKTALTGIVSIAAGNYYSLALDAAGHLWAWGENAAGQFGNGTTTGSYIAVQVPGVANVIAIAAGGTHSLALKSDGTVWTWGLNADGQLGNGSNVSSSSPVQVRDLTDVIAIAGGGYHSLALKADGTVWAWGDNYFGALGNGNTTSRNTPVQVSNLTGVTAIAAGNMHSLAVISDGTVWAWGRGDYGQVGHGANVGPNSTPVQVVTGGTTGLSGIVAIAGGQHFSLALRNDGTVWAWGDNGKGQLGNGTTARRNIAAQVPNIAGIAQVDSGWEFAYARIGKSLRFTTQPAGGNAGQPLATQPAVTVYGPDGSVDMTFTGEVTLAIAPNASAPGAILSGTTTVAAVAGVATFTDLSFNTAGAGYRLVASSISCLNAVSDPFDLAAVVTHAPVVTAPSDQTAVAGYQNSFALGSFTDSGGDGPWSVSIDWGDNSTDTTFQATATGTLPVTPHSYALAETYTVTVTVTDLAGTPGTATFTVAASSVAPSGTLLAWGNNEVGTLGDGTTADRHSPVVSLLSDARLVSAGGIFSLALTSDGTAWAWGSNMFGQLGIGTTGEGTDSSLPVPVSSLSNATALAAGYYHSLALKSDGTVWAWGSNVFSQLGIGTTDTASSLPVPVPDFTNVVAIGAGYGHSLALKADGTVWAWGWNNWRQLGDGTATQRNTPVQVVTDATTLDPLTDVIAIAAGGGHNLALKKDGTVWAWGDNQYNQLGNNSTTPSGLPVQVLAPTGSPGTFLTDIIAIAAGGGHSLALKKDGTVWAWGDNYSGQLGNNSTTNSGLPVQVLAPTGSPETFLTDVIAMDGGGGHSMFLRSDGTVLAVGVNEYGELGNGASGDGVHSTVPIQVPGIAGAIQVSGGYAHSLALLGKSLRFTTQPSNATVGAAITPALVVKAYNTDGTPDASFAGSVTLAIRPYTGTTGATLAGATATASAGVATFSGLSVTTAGTGYMLVATAEGYADACSQPFDVTGVPCIPPSPSGPQNVFGVCEGQSRTIAANVSGTEPLTYQWYRGSVAPGNLIANETSASITTSEAGNYYVAVSNGCGNYAGFVATLIVRPGPAITSVEDKITGTEAGACSASVAFSAIVTGDPAPTVTYSIGNTTITSPHRFEKGTTTVTVTAANDCGSDTDTFTVTVNDAQAPLITLLGANPMTVECAQYGPGPSTVEWGDPGATVTDNCDDPRTITSTTLVRKDTPNTFTVTYTAQDAAGNVATPVTRTVIVVDTRPPVITLLGDNPLRVAKGGPFTDPGATVSDTCATGLVASISGTVNVDVPGDYVLTYTATDGTNSAVPVTRTVKVNHPPVTNDIPNFWIVHRSSRGRDINLAESTSDADGDPLTYSVGTADHGTVSVNAATGIAHYTPTGDTVGYDAFTYTASDGLNSSTSTVTVELYNYAPTLLPRDASASVSHKAGSEVVFQYDAGDVDGDSVRVEVVTYPTYGTLTLIDSEEATEATYEAGGANVATDTFQLVAVDPHGVKSPVQTFTVTLTNVAPVASPGTASVPHKSTAGVDIDLRAFVTDAETDPLTFSVGTADYGTVTVDAESGLAHYTPGTTDTVAPAHFTYTANDGRVTSSAGTVMVTLTNNLPTATVSLAPLEPKVADPIVATANGSDADSDPVTLAYVWYRNNVKDTSQTTNTYTSTKARGDAIEVFVTPNDGHGDGAYAYASVTVAGTAPVATLVEAADPAKPYEDETVQYSDPIREGLLTVTEPDSDTVTATMAGAPPDITLVAVEPPGSNTWTLSGLATVGPGEYPVVITISDADGSVDLPFTITILPEDGLATYTGATFVATESITSGKATVLLAATIEDITAAGPDEPGYDPNAGDITNATVTFVNRTTGEILAENVPLGLLDPSDPTVAIATADCQIDIGAANSDTLNVGIIVGGWYDCDDTEYDTLVNIAKPIPNFITGGGYLVNAASAGLKAGTVGLKTNFGFGVKYNKGLKNLQGRASLIVRSGGSVYMIKSTAIQSLAVKPPSGTTPGTATFTSRATIQEISNPAAPISIDGNASLQITMTDYGEPGARDTIAITLFNKGGGLWFTSCWTGRKPAEQLLAGGNVVVR